MKASSIAQHKWLFLILFLGLLLRLIDIAKPFSGLGKWNEGHYAMTALNYFKYGVFLPMNEYGLDVTTTPIFSWLIYLSFLVFGIHEWAARLPSLIFGMFSMVLVYAVAERLYGKNVALVAVFIAAISPGVVYFSVAAQLESMFTAFSLAALLFLLYYMDTNDVKWLTASGIYLSISILTKYPAILVYPALLCVWFTYRGYGSRVNAKFWLYLIMPVLPTLLWVFYAVSVKPSLTVWYFNKPEAPWSFTVAIKAFYFAITRYIPEHFGYVFYLPFLLSLPWILRELKRNAIIVLFTFSWLLLILAFPEFYLSNMYYHYPMLYGMAILLGYSVVSLGGGIIKRMHLNLKAVGAFVVALALISSFYQFNVYFHSYYTDFSKANETEPFQSAKYVALINTDHEPVVADYPMTMFYLGGDPEYIKLAYTTQGLINAAREDKYTYVVTYYEGNSTLREVIEEHNYTQIAPRAWRKSK